MDIFKLLLIDFDSTLISILRAYIYDKIKITLTENKSDSEKLN